VHCPIENNARQTRSAVDGRAIGFIAFREGRNVHLYVLLEHERRGAGGVLLNRRRQLSQSLPVGVSEECRRLHRRGGRPARHSSDIEGRVALVPEPAQHEARSCGSERPDGKHRLWAYPLGRGPDIAELPMDLPIAPVRPAGGLVTVKLQNKTVKKD
jgi:hypothetical protein